MKGTVSMYDMTLLVQKFRDGRKRLGINQTEFARRLGVSLATITRWERANMVYTPDIRQLSLIADMFGTTVWELLTPDATKTVTFDESPAGTETLAPEVEPAAQETSPIVSNDETPEEHSETQILTGDELPEEQPATPVVIPDDSTETVEPVTIDEATEQPADASEIISTDETPEAPEAAPQDQAPDTVINDDVKPDNESLTEVSPAQMELPETVTPDESLTENTTAPDLFEIVHHDESPAETENFITESEPAAPEIPPIISSDEIPEDPSDTLIVTDDDAPGEQPDMPVVTSDDIPKPASSVTNDDAIPAEIPTEEPVIHDEPQEPQETVNVDEGHAPDATLITNEELPQDTDILSAPDETVPEPVTAEAQELVTTDETAEPATNTPKLVKSDEIPEAAPQAQSAQDAKAKPWEELGISRAWYYRLKQHGRLEEYLKERAEQ